MADRELGRQPLAGGRRPGQGHLEEVAAVEGHDRQQVEGRPAEGGEGRRPQGEAAERPRRPVQGTDGVEHRQADEDPGRRAGGGQHGRLAPAEGLGR